MRNSTYVLITAARNEEGYIRRTLQAVVDQKRLPRTWVIVSDGSTDRTDELVMHFARSHHFIQLVRLRQKGARAFSSQACASNEGYKRIKHAEFDFVGFLDADISFSPNYYEELLEKMEANPRLGIAGGVIVEDHGSGRFDVRYGDSADHVAGAIQCFRRECHDDIGGLIPLRWGGHDAVANAMARRKGWEVRAFSDLRAFHHRPTGTAGTTIRRARFREGMQDYFMGYHLLFEVGKCIRRAIEPPYLAGSVLRLSGYLWPGLTRQKPMVTEDFAQYLKKQQMRRLFHVGKK
ncbi:MAG TPA: glycosyltransferase family 2 protein [Terriglobia bacterium]|nr:glycosyltransferase family 2 protein [Terriglobia bacterium]